MNNLGKNCGVNFVLLQDQELPPISHKLQGGMSCEGGVSLGKGPYQR